MSGGARTGSRPGYGGRRAPAVSILLRRPASAFNLTTGDERPRFGPDGRRQALAWGQGWSPRPAHYARASSPMAPRVLAGSRRHATITPRFTANFAAGPEAVLPLAQTESQTEASPIDSPAPSQEDADPRPPAGPAAGPT